MQNACLRSRQLLREQETSGNPLFWRPFWSLDDPRAVLEFARSSRCKILIAQLPHSQQSLSCRDPATFVSRYEATYQIVPSKRWPLLDNSKTLASSPSVEPAFTGHCGGDGERCDARPEGSGDVAIAAAPVALRQRASAWQRNRKTLTPRSCAALLKQALEFGFRWAVETVGRTLPSRHDPSWLHCRAPL